MKLKAIFEKYKSDDLHFGIRFFICLIVFLSFMVFSAIIVDSSQRSCLGPPQLLLFAFIGFPFLTFLLLLDLIVLAFLRSLSWQKAIVNIGLFSSLIFFLVLAYN